ncbi:gamma-tubulin complex component 6 [Lycorma delicatula]|uniref:gamma-tubulin complex component 6 n=1 Tax=Lycorma delicatula TaxID=130591 RepID=UPI003F514D2B
MKSEMAHNINTKSQGCLWSTYLQSSAKPIYNDENSVPDLIDKLCSKLSDDLDIDEGSKKRKIVKKLRILAYKILLKKTQSSDVEDINFEHNDELIAALVDKVYVNELSSSSWTKKKNQQLHKLVDYFSECMFEKPMFRNVLTFLLHASEPKRRLRDQAQQSSFGLDLKNLDLDSRFQSLQSNSNFYDTFNGGMPNYSPQSSFDVRLPLDCQNNPIISKISGVNDYPFQTEPGSGLNLFEKYSSSWSLNKNNRNLAEFPSQRRMKSLSIPELNPEVPRSITIPSMRSSHLDEGYVTPDKEFLDEQDRDSNTFDKNISHDIWKNLTVQNLNEPLRYTWESFGKAEAKKEPPFLLESETSVVEYWKKYNSLTNYYNNNGEETSTGSNSSGFLFSGITGTASPQSFELNTLSYREFFRDIQYLLIAINSKTFHYDETQKSFVIKCGVCVPGLTPEGLKIFSKDLINCGNNFRTISLLIKKNEGYVKTVTCDDIFETTVTSTAAALTTSSSTISNTTKNVVMGAHNGLIFEAMCSSISNWLQIYRGSVIKMIENESCSLLELKSWLHPLQLQLQFLVRLCCPSSPNRTLPLGGALLSHIYNVAQVTVSAPFSFILYHILEKCSRVYFRFLEKWLFEGICDDPYGEFFIESKSNYETILDRSYWRKAFVLRRERVPVFLQNLVNDIFVCGKSLNLVKLCNPSDPLCQCLENPYPRIVPCLEVDSLDQLAAEYHGFVLSCEEECSEVLLSSVFSPGFETEEDKEAHYESCAKQRAESMAKIKEAQQEQLKLKSEKKKKLLEAMKKQMLEAENRKKENKKKELEEEKKILSEMAVAAINEASIKNEEKHKIMKYYKSLSDAADQRRLRAEWKMKRLKLNNIRLDFFAEDKQNLKEELLKNRQKQYRTKEKPDHNFNSPVQSVLSTASSSSWRTCPSFSVASVSGCNSATETENKNNCNVILSLDTIHSSSFSLRRCSLSDCSVKKTEEKIELKLKRSSSDTDIYNCLHQLSNLKTGYDLVNNNINNFNDLFDDTAISQSHNIADSKSPSVKAVFNRNVNDNNFIIDDRILNAGNSSGPTIIIKKPASQKLLGEVTIENLNVNFNGGQMSITEKDHLKNTKRDSNINIIDERNILLNKLFSDTRNAALLNKQKVYENEYGINDATSLYGKNKANKDGDGVSSSKDKVLELKMKSNESAIRERTQQLQLACSNVVESRKEAARNKARAMRGLSNFIDNTELVSEYPKIKTMENESTNQNDKSVIKRSIFDNESSCSSVLTENNNLQIRFEEDDIDNNNCDEKASFMSNSEFIDSMSKFIAVKKPLIIDIADKCFKSKPFSSFSIESADITTIHYCLFRSVAIPTEIQKSFTNDAILRLFIINEKLIDHLQCIRKHFFLLDGEYGHILTRHLFTDLENAEHPSALLTHLRLNAILRSASRSLINESPYMERLSFFVKETPLAFLLTDPEVLNCLSMRYRTHWPLNIILTNESIFNYDRIFAFQLKLQRTAWVLNQDIQLLKIKNMKRSVHYRQLQIFRHTMNQFVRALSNYVTAIALEESWLEFKKALNKVDTLDSLYSAHVDYIKMTLFRCLLNKRSEPLHKTVMELLRTILTFHELLRNGEWVFDSLTGNHTHSAFSRLFHQYSTFARVVRYLLKYLHQLVCRGYQPHLDVLITFLSGNDFYLK